MTPQEKTHALIKQRQPRHALSRELYHDQDVYQQDLEQIWYKNWIFIGHTFELEEEGDYITAQIGDYPIMVIRDEDEDENPVYRAFHNACRHRGARMCKEEKGSVARITCPYHQWTYDLEGNMVYAPHMQDNTNFDKSKLSLLPVHCEVVNTYIYVCVADTPPNFEPFRQDLAPFLNSHKLEDCKVAYESTIVEKGNWKLVFENNRECYHCDSNHPELCVSFVENPSVAGIGGDDPELQAHWDKCEAAGMPSRLVMAEDGRYRMTRIPLFGDSISYTLDGQFAVTNPDLRLDDSGENDIGALLYFNYPNTWNHFLGDHALSFRVLPLDNGSTAVTTKWLVHKDAVEGKDYDFQRLTEVWIATNNQDRELVEETFVGVSSPNYIPGPFSDITENGVCQFVDWYCATMDKELNQ